MELCKIAKSLNEAAIAKVSSKTPSCHFVLFNGHFFIFPTVYNVSLAYHCHNVGAGLDNQ